MPPEIVNLAGKLASFSDHWNPRIVGGYNGHELRVAKVEGEFSWHSHAETDELFLVLDGELRIEFRDGVRNLRAGDLLVVPAGVEHRPAAEREAAILLIDREGEPNTGSSPSALTRATLEAI